MVVEIANRLAMSICSNLDGRAGGRPLEPIQEDRHVSRGKGHAGATVTLKHMAGALAEGPSGLSHCS
jgi:hypothetical protein